MNSFPILLLFCSGLLGQPSRNLHYDSWQFTGGRFLFKNFSTWDAGIQKYKTRERSITFFGVETGFHYKKVNNHFDLSQPARIPSIRVGEDYFFISKFHKEHFLRLKFHYGYGVKIIKKEKYTSDILMNFGIGWNMYDYFENHYYKLDTLNYPMDPLFKQERIKYFYNPDLFLALKSVHFYKLNATSSVYLGGNIGYTFALSEKIFRKYRSGIFVQLTTGISIVSRRKLKRKS